MGKILRASVVAAVALIALSLSGRALAQEDDAARRHFRLGEAHYDNGQFLEAAHEWEEAYRLSNRPQLLYNIHVAYRDAQDTPHAYESLRRFLELVPDTPDRDQLQGRLAAMERTLRASGQLPNGTTTTTTTTQTDTTQTDTTQTDTTQTDTTQTDTTDTTADSTSDTTDSSDGGGGVPIVPIVVGGVGVAMVIGGIITGVMASGKASELEDACPSHMNCDPALESTRDSGKTLALVTDILLFTGLAAIATGVVLFFVMGSGGDEEPPATAGFGCDGHGCAGSVRVRF